uniref:Granuliberin-R n=1 Tax=Glandirana rugosa TaxID=8410 RepID=GRAR_GLARU|nr:RecName: Full=Granuliberin-R [Glandirana rugosa]
FGFLPIYRRPAS